MEYSKHKSAESGRTERSRLFLVSGSGGMPSWRPEGFFGEHLTRYSKCFGTQLRLESACLWSWLSPATIFKLWWPENFGQRFNALLIGIRSQRKEPLGP